MKFTDSIDLYIADMRTYGRINSDATERGYRHTLEAHCEDCGGYDPAFSDRNDVKTTLRRWPNANTQRKSRSILISFYDWAMEEGYRPDNPARQTRRPRKAPTSIYRLTAQEASAMLAACREERERRVVYLGVCAGLRLAELRGLRGVHFARPGFVHVSADIAKGKRPRWVPVLQELEPVIADILKEVGDDEYVIPAQRWRNGWDTSQGRRDLLRQPASAQAIYYLVGRVGERAGIHAKVHPHLMRHAFADHIARHAGLKNAQQALGHATVSTTEGYVGMPTLDDLQAAFEGLRFTPRTDVPASGAQIPFKARTGIEPVEASGSELEPTTTASRALVPVLTALRAAFLPIVRNGGAGA